MKPNDYVVLLVAADGTFRVHISAPQDKREGESDSEHAFRSGAKASETARRKGFVATSEQVIKRTDLPADDPAWMLRKAWRWDGSKVTIDLIVARQILADAQTLEVEVRQRGSDEAKRCVAKIIKDIRDAIDRVERRP